METEMACDHNWTRSGMGRRNPIASRIRMLAAAVAILLGGAYGALAKELPSLQPYGSNGEIVQCVANMRASLHGASILGPRGTAAFIQDQGYLESLGYTEYDLMVDRCRTRFFQRYNRASGRQ
jgi:hypothetical protein